MAPRRTAPVAHPSHPPEARPSAPAPALPSPPSLVVEATGAEAAYERFLPLARALPAPAVVVWNGSALVALQNARTGVSAVLAEREALTTDPEAPRVDFARIERVPALAEALVFAVRRVANASSPPALVKPKLARACELRTLLLSGAVALARARVLDEKAVARIQSGSGAVDVAQDCIDLAALYRAHGEVIGNRTAVTANDLREAAALGTELLALLDGNGVEGAPPRAVPLAEATAIRDRFGTLLTQEYTYVARIGGYRWGHALAQHVPPLRSRSLARREGRPPKRPPNPVDPA